jgi:CubicO group peptidase (beta-lactamase class C family)
MNIEISGTDPATARILDLRVRDLLQPSPDATAIIHIGTAGLNSNPVKQYRAASITKAAVALAYACLVTDTRLDLDTPLNHYLPGIGDHRTTLHRCLAHTAGLPTDPQPDPWATRRFPHPDELLNWSRATALATVDEYRYSNVGYALLGQALERITGSTWFDHLTETVLSPLAATHTTLQPTAAVADEDTAVDLAGLGPAGQLWTTPQDLTRLATAMHPDTDALEIGRDTLTRFARVRNITDRHWTTGAGLGIQTFRRDLRFTIGSRGVIGAHQAFCASDGNTTIAVVTVGAAPNGALDVSAFVETQAWSDTMTDSARALS